MSNIGFTLKGGSAFNRRLKGITRKLGNSTNNALYSTINKAGEVVRAEAVKGISKGARTGNTYKRGKGGATHTASAEGEMPKTDTGNLVNNITVERAGRYAIEVGSRIQAPEGYWLETKEGSQGGRPWLAPTFSKNAKRIEAMIAKTVKKVVEKG